MKKYLRYLCLVLTLVFTLSIPITALADDEDTTPPTINAYILNGLLKISAVDESDIKAIYINGYEYLDPVNGSLTIRLEKFESSIETFEIYAMDGKGNLSDKYYLENPYYTPSQDDSDDKSDEDTEDLAEELPDDASATDPTIAIGEVVDYDFYYLTSDGSRAREFYTITANTGKVFYLIIETSGDQQVCYFLTEISENDLLNVTDNSYMTLPKNSLSDGSNNAPLTTINIPNEDGTSVNVDPVSGEQTALDENGEEIIEEEPEPEVVEEPVVEEKPKNNITSNPMVLYGGIAGIVLIVGIIKIKLGKKKDDYVEDEDQADSNDDVEVEDEKVESDADVFTDKEQSDKDFFESIDEGDL